MPMAVDAIGDRGDVDHARVRDRDVAVLREAVETDRIADALMTTAFRLHGRSRRRHSCVHRDPPRRGPDVGEEVSVMAPAPE